MPRTSGPTSSRIAGLLLVAPFLDGRHRVLGIATTSTTSSRASEGQRRIAADQTTWLRRIVS